MLIDFSKIKEIAISHMSGGEGEISAKMFMDENGKVMVSRIPVGASIGEHVQKTSNDINYVLSGTGKAICDGQSEELIPGVCH